jgi:hypothetical protein
MLTWDEVRKLLVQHVAPAVQPLGFGAPGRRMQRQRDPFVDVIEFGCHKWGDRVQLSLGCGLRAFVPPNPHPWSCPFARQHFPAWPDDALVFADTVEEQEARLAAFRPLFVAEVQRWFALLPDLHAARRAADHNDPDSPTAVGHFAVPSRAYDEVVRQLQALMDSP